MKKALYLSLGLAGVLYAPGLLASASSHLDDQGNIRPAHQMHQVTLADGSHKDIIVNHSRKSTAPSSALLMHMHAVHKVGRLKEKLTQAHFGFDQEGAAAIGGYFPNMKGSGVDFQNSWGTSWGENGFCYIPVSMINNADTLGDMEYVSGAKASKSAAAAS